MYDNITSYFAYVDNILYIANMIKKVGEYKPWFSN